jgi:hypothetical protein
MEERDNKTIMCSVLFLDIVEYSKKSVSGQISLKDRFNSFLSAAIRDVPITDRIILDTGDGAAINFLGDVEDALKTALSLRESLLNEDINVDPPLLVRMGVNIGPVRLVRDINGQPNIVGDGINVAQRVMGFADAAQILVSRSYYDAVSRLSPKYAGMFHYQGSRTDKHVREHEVYAIGYPGDKTIRRGKKQSSKNAQEAENYFFERAKAFWRFAASRLDLLIEHLVDGFRQADLKQRVLYVVVTIVPLVLIILLVTTQVRHDKIPAAPTGAGDHEASMIQPGSAVVSASAVAAATAVADVKAHDVTPEQPKGVPKTKIQKSLEGKKPKDIIKYRDGQGTAKAKPLISSEIERETASAGTFISVNCTGAEVFVDGTRKGRAGSAPFTGEVPPGKHSIIVSHTKGVYSKEIIFDRGKTVHLQPDFCN